MRLIRLFCILVLSIFLVRSVAAQEVIYIPIIIKGPDTMLNSTIRITIPIGRKNYTLNPSGELTGNFSAQGGASVARSSSFQLYGLYSYEVSGTGSGQGINLTLLALEDFPHYVTFYVHVANGSQDNIRLNVTIGSKTVEAKLLEKIDRGNYAQWDLYGIPFSSTDTVSQTNLRITQVLSGNSLVYIDGIQVEQISTDGSYSTYIDGSQPGCRWLGAPNASASVRSADSRAGGIAKEFWDGFKFFPEKAIGMGTVIEELNIDSYAFLPGGELNSSKIPVREFSIIGYFYANTLPELHTHAQALEKELGLNTYPASQPVRLRYLGAAVQKEIAAHYTGGLEGDLPVFYNDGASEVYDISQEDDKWTKNFKYKMRASINFKALDPYWYELGESATLLDTNDTITMQNIAARLMDTGQWDVLGPPTIPGTAAYTGVYAIAEDATYLYLGGAFSNWDNVANSDKIVRYNKQTGIYSSMGTGISGGDVYAIVIGPDGLVYVGGEFTSAGGVASTSKIAVWNPVTEAWATLSSVFTNVYAIAFSPDGLLYAGGQSAAHVNDIAYWDGATWTGIAVTNNTIFALAFDNNGLLYAGGSFTIMEGVGIDKIATWDGSDWADIGGITNTSVRAITVNPLNNLVYIGGIFDTAGGVSVNNITVYNGAIFSPLGDGIGAGGFASSAVYAITIGPDSLVYIGGAFDTAGDISSPGLTVWNGYTFAHLDIVLPDPTNKVIYSIAISKYDIDPVVNKIYTFYIGSNVRSTNGDATIAGLVTVENEGSISAFPKIVFARSGGTSATIISLRNERTGRVILFEYALLDGESLTIDLNPKNRTIISSFFGPRMGARLKNDDFSVWQLLPGDNGITAYVSEGGSPTVTGYILYKTPYKSWN